MDIKGMGHAALRGTFDSCKGMVTIFYLDKEINSERSKGKCSPSIRQNVEIREGSPQRQQKKKKESKIMHNVVQCAVLNGGVFLLSVLVFEYVLLPSLDSCFNFMFGSTSYFTRVVWFWTKNSLLFIYRTAWIVPLFLLSKIINALWFQDIADTAYRHTRGRPVSFSTVSMFFADQIFSIIVQMLFLIQATITSYIPIYPVGTILYFVQMSLLYSLYSFEYKWFNMGWELHRRLAFIEANWPYFVGFGLPLTILTQMPESSIISGCIFSIFFPFFIISGNQADPVIGVRSFQLQLFSLVISLANTIFSKTIGQSKKNPVPAQR